MRFRTSTHQHTRLATAALLVAALAVPSAQTPIALEENDFTVAEDVQLGQEAAAEARQQLPLLDDDRVDDYVEDIGRILVGGIPAELRHDGFRYSFDVVNQQEINAFALPGGPMFLNRGMLEAARSEGEIAGVMAHEIAHVALRHGTAQVSRSQTPAILGTIGQIAGAILGGTAGAILSQGSQIGAGLTIMRYSREYERQADLLGAQIMARAGYDPRQMASMFQTIQEQGGSGGPEWLSSHPNPENRYEAITHEAAMLRVQGNANTGDFASIQSRLRGMSPAFTAEQVASGQAQDGRPVGTSGRAVSVEPPASQYRVHTPTRFLRVSVPANWGAVEMSGGVTYAPEGAVFSGASGPAAFTHGVQFGVAQGGSRDLQRDTQQLLQGLAQANPDLRQAGSAQPASVDGRQAIVTPLSNVSQVTGQREAVTLTTTRLADGSLLYMIGVAPQTEARTYDAAFQRVRQSVQIAD